MPTTRSATITPTVPPRCSAVPRTTCGPTNSNPPPRAHWRQPRGWPFTATLYASRTQLPITAWQQHFADAATGIDILVLAATFLFDTLDGFLDTLLAAAGRGVQVRFLIGDPDTATTILRGEEEGIGEAVIARCRTSVELLAPHAGTPGLHIRTHDTTLYTSTFRVDDTMIVNFHIYGSPGRNNPVLVLSRHHEPRLWATLEQAFANVWDNANPLIRKG